MICRVLGLVRLDEWMDGSWIDAIAVASGDAGMLCWFRFSCLIAIRFELTRQQKDFSEGISSPLGAGDLLL